MVPSNNLMQVDMCFLYILITCFNIIRAFDIYQNVLPEFCSSCIGSLFLIFKKKLSTEKWKNNLVSKSTSGLVMDGVWSRMHVYTHTPELILVCYLSLVSAPSWHVIKSAISALIKTLWQLCNTHQQNLRSHRFYSNIF